MKYLIVPGAPLLVIALALHDTDSVPAQATSLVALALLLGGGAFVLFYFALRLFQKI